MKTNLKGLNTREGGTVIKSATPSLSKRSAYCKYTPPVRFDGEVRMLSSLVFTSLGDLDDATLKMLEQTGKLLDAAPLSNEIMVWFDDDIHKFQKDSRGEYRKVFK